MKRSSGRLHVAPQSQELEVLQLIPVEVSAHIDALAPHDDDLVAVKQELGHDGGQTAHQVTPGIDHHGLKLKFKIEFLKLNFQ